VRFTQTEQKEAIVKVGSLGTGNIGEVFARKLRLAGHQVKMANARGPDSIAGLANQIGAKAVDIEGVVEDVDVLVLTIPTKNVPDLPPALFRRLPPGAVVIDTTNYYPSFRDGPIGALEEGMLESDWVSERIGYPVVKAMNTMFSHSLSRNGRPAGAADRLALAISGDDPNAKATVAALIDSIGFEPVDIGGMAGSWRQQAGSPIYCTDLTRAELLAWVTRAKRELLSERREAVSKLYATWPSDVR